MWCIVNKPTVLDGCLSSLHRHNVILRDPDNIRCTNDWPYRQECSFIIRWYHQITSLWYIVIQWASRDECLIEWISFKWVFQSAQSADSQMAFPLSPLRISLQLADKQFCRLIGLSILSRPAICSGRMPTIGALWSAQNLKLISAFFVLFEGLSLNDLITKLNLL